MAFIYSLKAFDSCKRQKATGADNSRGTHSPSHFVESRDGSSVQSTLHMWIALVLTNRNPEAASLGRAKCTTIQLIIYKKNKGLSCYYSRVYQLSRLIFFTSICQYSTMALFLHCYLKWFPLAYSAILLTFSFFLSPRLGTDNIHHSFRIEYDYLY